MTRYVLTDAAFDLWTEDFRRASDGTKPGAEARWSIAKRVLRGGRRHGVDLIEVDNGALAFSIVPTRGLGIWSASYRGNRIGWRSPIRDGPVNPAFVNLAARGGLGWLEGFDELLARCGTACNGPPCEDGGLHGKIANLPAHFVAVEVDEESGEIAVEGHVDETELFFAGTRMISRISTCVGSNRLTVCDEFVNLRAMPGDLEILYHWNFGPPYLEDGATLRAPAEAVCPRDATAAAAVDSYTTYGPPRPGFAEQVYYFKLLGDGPEAKTVAALVNRSGDKAVALRFSARQLPAFTVWKNTGPLSDGYVTGLEPATNYPNPKPIEQARGRVIRLNPGQSHVAETTLEVFDGLEPVAALIAEIDKLQRQAAPVVHPSPVEPFAPEAKP